MVIINSEYFFKSTFFVVIMIIFMIICSCKSCPKNKKDFLENYNNLIANVKEKKRKKTDNDWDLIDKRFEKLLKECYPKFAKEMSNNEAILFWEDALGYSYLRFGNILLKKFSAGDNRIIRIRDSIISRNIQIGPAVKRLCKEWPVLSGTSEQEVTITIKKAFEYKKRKKKMLNFLKDSLN